MPRIQPEIIFSRLATPARSSAGNHKLARQGTSVAVASKKESTVTRKQSTTKQAREGSNGRKEARKEAFPQPGRAIIPTT